MSEEERLARKLVISPSDKTMKGTENDSQSNLERLVEIKVRQVLAEMLNVSHQPEPQSLSAKDAYLVLGYRSIRQLYRDIEDGLLRVGIEVEDRRRPNAERPRYFIDLLAARKRLKRPPEKRT